MSSALRLAFKPVGLIAGLPANHGSLKTKFLSSVHGGAPVLEGFDAMGGDVIPSFERDTTYDFAIAALLRRAGISGEDSLRILTAGSLLRVGVGLLRAGRARKGCLGVSEAACRLALDLFGSRIDPTSEWEQLVALLKFLASQTVDPEPWTCEHWQLSVTASPERLIPMLSLVGGGHNVNASFAEREVIQALANGYLARNELMRWERGILEGRPTRLRGAVAEEFRGETPSLNQVGVRIVESGDWVALVDDLDRSVVDLQIVRAGTHIWLLKAIRPSICADYEAVAKRARVVRMSITGDV
jgi:hypothetical protein